MNIQFKRLVKGTLIGESGYTKISSTSEVPVVSASFEDKHGQNWLSPNFASLIAFRTENSKSLSVVHIQGQHNGVQSRMYDTRIYYNIEAEEIRKTDSKLGAIIGSLPKMEKYNEKRIGFLKTELQVKDIQDYDSEKADNLCEYILQAIVESKYLLIKLNEDSDWKENKVLDNIVSKTLFAAIDKLPIKLRPAVSFALSVDEKYNKEFLEDLLVVLYHGNNNFGFKSTIELDWKDLKNNTKTNYLAQSKYFSELISSILRGKIDFYDTNSTSNDMVLDIFDANNTIKTKKTISECNTENEIKIMVSLREVQLLDGSQQEKLNAIKDLLKIQQYSDTHKKKLIEQLPQEIFNHSDIKPLIEKLLLMDLNANIEKGSLDLDDIYDLYKYFKKETIANLYTKIYFDKKISGNKIAQQIEAIQNTFLRISDKILSVALKNITIDSVLHNYVASDWDKVAKFVMGTEYEQTFKDKTKQYNLSDYEILLKSNKHIDLVMECFYNSNAYKNNSEELCKKPFVQYLKPEKIKELRDKYLTRFSEFEGLFSKISIDEILGLLKINNNEQTIFKLANAKKLSGKFVNQKNELCEEELKKAFYKPDFIQSGIYKLYQNANILVNKPEVELDLKNLEIVFKNAQDLKFDLTLEITELYKLNSNVTAWHKIHEITKQKQADKKIDKKVDSEIELDDCLYLQKEGFTLPEICVERLIQHIQKRNGDNIDIEELLSKLKNLGISLSDYKEEIINKLSNDKKKNKQFIKEYFGKEGEGNPKETDTENEPSIFKKSFDFLKTHKVTACIVMSALFIGFGGGYKVGYKKGNFVATNGLPNDSIKTQVQDTTRQEVNDLEIIINDTIYLYYSKGTGSDATFKISDSTVNTLKLDTIRYKNLLDSANNNRLLQKFYPVKFISLKYREAETQLDFQVDGPNSNKKFYKKIDSLTTKQK